MSLFTKNQANAVQLSERVMLENKFKNSRHNILLVVAFTLINIILLVTQSNTYFLFSAFVPYMLADLGMYLCGKYPTEFYGEELSEITFLNDGFLAVMLVIAAVILVFYGLCWLLSKKMSKGWMIAALVFFVLDTVLLLVMQGIDMSMILDYVFHGWVIVSLCTGISAAKKLKNLPEEPEIPEAPEGLEESAEQPQEEE